MLIPRAVNSLHVIHDRVLLALMITASCASFSGCGDSGPQRVSVAGLVTVDGQPLSRRSLWSDGFGRR
jgi:hypothetical protein